MDALCRENPGTVVVWRFEDGSEVNTNQFQRVFWSIEGLNSCRPVISIDGTHLYGQYRGMMLVIVAVDADQLFPLAFAIVEGENNDSWRWFMACIRARVTQREELCIISNRHRGIIVAMPNLYSKLIQRQGRCGPASSVNAMQCQSCSVRRRNGLCKSELPHHPASSVPLDHFEVG